VLKLGYDLATHGKVKRCLIYLDRAILWNSSLFVAVPVWVKQESSVWRADPKFLTRQREITTYSMWPRLQARRAQWSTLTGHRLLTASEWRSRIETS
jgi:hypothetical protein